MVADLDPDQAGVKKFERISCTLEDESDYETGEWETAPLLRYVPAPTKTSELRNKILKAVKKGPLSGSHIATAIQKAKKDVLAEIKRWLMKNNLNTSAEAQVRVCVFRRNIKQFCSIGLLHPVGGVGRFDTDSALNYRFCRNC